MKAGDLITIQHPEYGTLTGRVHGTEKSGFYLPLGIGYLTLGRKLDRPGGWAVVEPAPVLEGDKQ